MASEGPFLTERLLQMADCQSLANKIRMAENLLGEKTVHLRFFANGRYFFMAESSETASVVMIISCC